MPSFSCSSLRLALSIHHVPQIRHMEPDPQLSGPLCKSGASAGLSKPEPRAWISLSARQTSNRDLLRRVHRQIRSGQAYSIFLVSSCGMEGICSRRWFAPLAPMERRALVSPRARATAWLARLAPTSYNLVGPLHDWDGLRLIAEPYYKKGPALLSLPGWRPRRVGDFDCQIRDAVSVGVDHSRGSFASEAVLRGGFHTARAECNSFKYSLPTARYVRGVL